MPSGIYSLKPVRCRDRDGQAISITPQVLLTTCDGCGKLGAPFGDKGDKWWCGWDSVNMAPVCKKKEAEKNGLVEADGEEGGNLA